MDFRKYNLTLKQQSIMCAVYACTIYFIWQSRNDAVWNYYVPYPGHVVTKVCNEITSRLHVFGLNLPHWWLMIYLFSWVCAVCTPADCVLLILRWLLFAGGVPCFWWSAHECWFLLSFCWSWFHKYWCLWPILLRWCGFVVGASSYWMLFGATGLLLLHKLTGSGWITSSMIYEIVWSMLLFVSDFVWCSCDWFLMFYGVADHDAIWNFLADVVCIWLLSDYVVGWCLCDALYMMVHCCCCIWLLVWCWVLTHVLTCCCCCLTCGALCSLWFVAAGLLLLDLMLFVGAAACWEFELRLLVDLCCWVKCWWLLRKCCAGCWYWIPDATYDCWCWAADLG